MDLLEYLEFKVQLAQLVFLVLAVLLAREEMLEHLVKKVLVELMAKMVNLVPLVR